MNIPSVIYLTLTIILQSQLAIDWFWLQSWLIQNRVICTRIALLWRDTTGTQKASSESLCSFTISHLARKIRSQNQSIKFTVWNDSGVPLRICTTFRISKTSPVIFFWEPTTENSHDFSHKQHISHKLFCFAYARTRGNSHQLAPKKNDGFFPEGGAHCSNFHEFSQEHNNSTLTKKIRVSRKSVSSLNSKQVSSSHVLDI